MEEEGEGDRRGEEGEVRGGGGLERDRRGEGEADGRGR
jgi:hypothetical protein